MKLYLPLIAAILALSSCDGGTKEASVEEKNEVQKTELKAEIADKEKVLMNTSVRDKDATAKLLYTHYIDYADVYEGDSLAPDMLFKAAELANALGDYQGSLAIFKRIEKHYPRYIRIPESIFLQGFVYDNYLGQKGQAKEEYERFIKKYPNHQLAEQAKLSIQYLGMSDEEIVDKFKQNSVQ